MLVFILILDISRRSCRSLVNIKWPSLNHIFQRTTTFCQLLNILLALYVIRAAFYVVEALWGWPWYKFLYLRLLRVSFISRSLLLKFRYLWILKLWHKNSLLLLGVINLIFWHLFRILLLVSHIYTFVDGSLRDPLHFFQLIPHVFHLVPQPKYFLLRLLILEYHLLVLDLQFLNNLIVLKFNIILVCPASDKIRL
jgi:hypothetical protein